MLRGIYSSLKVSWWLISIYITFPTELTCGVGLAEPLFQRLTSSAAEPHLQALKELFINFWGERDQLSDSVMNDSILMHDAFSHRSTDVYY